MYGLESCANVGHRDVRCARARGVRRALDASGARDVADIRCVGCARRCVLRFVSTGTLNQWTACGITAGVQGCCVGSPNTPKAPRNQSDSTHYAEAGRCNSIGTSAQRWRRTCSSRHRALAAINSVLRRLARRPRLDLVKVDGQRNTGILEGAIEVQNAGNSRVS